MRERPPNEVSAALRADYGAVSIEDVHAAADLIDRLTRDLDQARRERDEAKADYLRRHK